MKQIQKIIRNCATLLPALAFFVGVLSVNQACFTFFHQTEVPEEMNAYRK